MFLVSQIRGARLCESRRYSMFFLLGKNQKCSGLKTDTSVGRPLGFDYSINVSEALGSALMAFSASGNDEF